MKNTLNQAIQVLGVKENYKIKLMTSSEFLDYNFKTNWCNVGKDIYAYDKKNNVLIKIKRETQETRL